MYKQLRQPNLSIKPVKGLCLNYARRVFNVGVKYATAWNAWSGASYKHYDRNMPGNVAVLVWFSYYARIGGVYKNWGHVAVHVPGKGVYTSHVNGKIYFPTLAALEKAASNLRYVGWTEDINGVRVVEPIKATAPAPAPNTHPYAWAVGKTVRLTGDKWRIYNVGSTAPRLAKATLRPNKYGGLSYKILRTDKAKNSVVIKTQNFGEVSLPLGYGEKIS